MGAVEIRSRCRSFCEVAEFGQEQVADNKHTDMGVYHRNIGRAHIVVNENVNLHLVFPLIRLFAFRKHMVFLCHFET